MSDAIITSDITREELAEYAESKIAANEHVIARLFDGRDDYWEGANDALREIIEHFCDQVEASE